MGQPWKRFFLMVIGTIFVLNIFNDGPLQPSNAEERVIISDKGGARGSRRLDDQAGCQDEDAAAGLTRRSCWSRGGAWVCQRPNYQISSGG